MRNCIKGHRYYIKGSQVRKAEDHGCMLNTLPLPLWVQSRIVHSGTSMNVSCRARTYACSKYKVYHKESTSRLKKEKFKYFFFIT